MLVHPGSHGAHYGRCGITPASLGHMRESIVKAVSDYVDIETGEEIEVGEVQTMMIRWVQACYPRFTPRKCFNLGAAGESIYRPRTGNNLLGCCAREKGQASQDITRFSERTARSGSGARIVICTAEHILNRLLN